MSADTRAAILFGGQAFQVVAAGTTPPTFNRLLSGGTHSAGDRVSEKENVQNPLIVFPVGVRGEIGSIVVAAISFFFASFFFLWRPVETVEILTAAGCSKL